MSNTPAVKIEVGTWLQSLVDEDGEPLLLRTQRWGCTHRQHTAIVDVGARTLTCSGCGANLDPYAYVGHLATDSHAITRGRVRLNELVESISDLEKRERAARARVKRWEAKAAKCG